MNKNQENYKKALDQISPSKELKEKTFKKITPKPKVKNIVFRKYLAACAVVAICFSIGIVYLNNNKQNKNNTTSTTIAIQENNLPRFESMEQLREVLESEENYTYFNDVISVEEDSSTTKGNTDSVATSEQNNYSETNTQVEGVDEADIVKTDGNYIYYATDYDVYIINSKKLEIEGTIKYNKESFYPKELYVNKNKLIILGTGYEDVTKEIDDENSEENIVPYYEVSKSKAIVYDISNKSKPKKEREIAIDGTYYTSRMIEDNIYLVSSKRMYYYCIDELTDDEILPTIKDSKNEDRQINCTEIAYFDETESNSFMIVAGFNLNNDEKVQTETFYGATSTVYVSQNNLYITQTKYKYTYAYYNTKSNSTIYKFKLEDSKIKLQAQAEVKGAPKDQFALDEYNGNLRIATTTGYDEKAKNQLYILDENLNEIGKIENLAKGEKIYSVRFINKMGYIVTFEQIDPLFVIDLSNPTNPEVKGELKIPGYSSYLHPYDETHIIGIGYNTKSNGYGGVTNDNMKMSMFDVSDLENPKEMFSIDIGTGSTYSEITSNHKALFYNKDKNLIGFAVSYYKNNNSKVNEFKIYKIDLEDGFEEYGALREKNNDSYYYENIRRAIYIDKTIYLLETGKISTYDLETLEKEEELELE